VRPACHPHLGGTATPPALLREAPVTVFLLDDHELARRGARAVLDAEVGLEVVGETGSAAVALARIADLRPGVTVIEGRLREGSGADTCRRVRAAVPGTGVVLLVEEHDDDLLFSAIAAGAAAVVLRRVTETALVDAVRRVAAGQQVLDPAVTERVLAQVRRDGRRGASPTHLTPQEERILGLLTQGLTDLQIAEELGLVERTVRNYVSVVVRKLGARTRTHAVVLADRRSRPVAAAQVRAHPHDVDAPAP
jgi:DNA-binding NarL/FixJ family response regulator